MTSETTITSAAIVDPAKIARNRREIRPALLPAENRDAAPMDNAGPDERPETSVAPVTNAGRTGKLATPTVAAAKQPSKSDTVLKLLRRKRGATIVELQEATGWQAHSVRGFLSGTIRKRMKRDVRSEPGADGARRYRVEA